MEVTDKMRGFVETAGSAAREAARRTREAVTSAEDRTNQAVSSMGDYLSHSNVRSMIGDVTQLIRQYPIPAVLLAAGLGLFLSTRMRSK